MNTNGRISIPVLFLAVLVGLALLILFRVARPQRYQPSPAVEELAVLEAAAAASEPVADSTPLAPPVTFRDGELPPVIPISLTGVITPAENDLWDKSPVFLAMPRGTQSLGGIEFWLEGMIQLQSKSSQDEKRNYRERIVVPLLETNFVDGRTEIVERSSNVASVHLLGATRYAGGDESTVASLVWRYADNTTLRTLIQSEHHVRDWIRLPYETPTCLPYAFSKVVWHGTATNQPGRKIRRLPETRG